MVLVCVLRMVEVEIVLEVVLEESRGGEWG